MELTITGAPAGQGRLDIPAQLQALREIQPDASVVLEQWIPFLDNMEKTVELENRWADAGLKYLKDHLAQTTGG
jgi:sugar phosphate isomerase/epimerase